MLSSSTSHAPPRKRRETLVIVELLRVNVEWALEAEERIAAPSTTAIFISTAIIRTTEILTVVFCIFTSQRKKFVSSASIHLDRGKKKMLT
jgi:hypothetical protein